MDSTFVLILFVFRPFSSLLLQFIWSVSPMEEHLPPPHQLIQTVWETEEVREALEKSRAALLNLCSTSTSTSNQHEDLLMKLANVDKLFLIHQPPGIIEYFSYARGKEAWAWGSRDMMLNLGDGYVHCGTDGHPHGRRQSHRTSCPSRGHGSIFQRVCGEIGGASSLTFTPRSLSPQTAHTLHIH